MAQVSTYLNFNRNAEEAFNFYKAVFKKDFDDGGFMRFKDMPPQEGQPPTPKEDEGLVLHVSLETIGGHRIMGSDVPESMGTRVANGNDVYICLQPDSRKEADQLFAALSEGGKIEMEMQDMFWGDYYGSLEDKFGKHWMIDYPSSA